MPVADPTWDETVEEPTWENSYSEDELADRIISRPRVVEAPEKPRNLIAEPPPDEAAYEAAIPLDQPFLDPVTARALVEANPNAMALSQILPRELAEGGKESAANLASGLTTPESLLMAPLFAVPYVGQGLAIKMGGEQLGSGLGRLYAGAERGDLREIGAGLVETGAGATMAVPAFHSPVRSPARIAASELDRAPLNVPDPDLVARNLAEPGTFRPQEQYGAPRIEAPTEMFEAGEVPFESMQRFGSRPLPPVEILPQSGRLPPIEILEEARPIVERETRGKVSFGAEAPTLLRTAVEKAEQVGLTKSAEAARKGANAETVRSDQGQVPEAGRRTEGVQNQGSENIQQPAPQPAESLGAQGGAQPEVPLKPRLVAAIKTASGRTYTGERHPFALASAMDQIRETGGTKAGEMAAELADAQQGFVDVQTGEFITRGDAAKKMGATGELTSEMIPEAELKANVADLAAKQAKSQEGGDLVLHLRDMQSRPIEEVRLKSTGDPIRDAELLRAELYRAAQDNRVSLRESSGTTRRPDGGIVLEFFETGSGMKWATPEDLATLRQGGTSPLQELRDLPADAGTAKAMELGAKVPQELIPELETLARTAADEANRVISEVDAMPNPTTADLARMSESSTRAQLLNEAVEASQGGEPAILARGKTLPIQPPDLVSRLEGMKFQNINEGKVFSLPHPDAIKAIGKQAWNDALDLAIGAVKAGRTIADAIEMALRHIRKSGNKFDEAQIRDNLQYTVSNEVVPDTAGESVKMRKSAERATTSPSVPKPVQERIAEAPESLYKQQSMERVEEAVGAMTEGELAAVPKDSDLYTAARLEQANRLFKAGKEDAGYSVFVELEKEGTRLGQLINQFKLLKGSRPENIVSIINSRLRKSGKDALTPEQARVAVDAAKKSKSADTALEKATVEWQKAPTAENAKKAEAALDAANASAVELQKFVGKFDPRSLSAILKAILQGNLLTPISQSANLIGNVNFQPARASTRGVATGLDIIDAALRNRPREITVQPLSGTVEAIKGVGRGLKKAPDVLARGTGESIKGETRAGLHPLRAWVNQFAKNPDMPTTGGKLTLKDRLGLAIEGTMGVPAEGMLRLLGAVDLPFKEAARARVTAEQLRLAKVPRDQWGFAQKFPELFLDKKARDIIQSETNRAVFQGESKTLNQFVNWAKSKGGVLDLLVATIAPYKLTPWNIIREILSYNPVIAMGRSVYDGAKGNSRSAKLNAGKFVTGTLLTAAGTWLYNKGLIAPSLDERDEAQKARILSGKVLPPNHINVSGLKRAMSGGDPAFQPGDDTRDMFRGGGLAGSIFYMIANIGRAMERGEEVPQGELWMSILRQSTLEQARFGMNQSFLSGVEGLLTAVKDGNTDTFLRQWLNTVGSIPLPNSLNTISRAMREYKPDFSADTFNKQVENMVRGKLGFAGLDDYLPLKRDFWGKPMRETPEGRNAIFYHFFDISKGQQVTSDPVELELYRLWRKSGDSRVIPSLPLKQITVRNTVYPLNPQQYEKFAELVGTRRREIVDSVAINPEFHKLTDEDKLKFLERVYLRGMDAAKAEFLIDNQDQLEAKPARAGFR